MSNDQDTGTAREAHALVRFSARLDEVLDSLAETPTWSMTTEELQQTLVSFARAEARLAGLRLRVLVGADRADVGAGVASSSTPAWVAHETRQTRPAAHSELRLARTLDEELTLTQSALAAATVNLDQARVIVRAVGELPATVSAGDRRRAEAHLVELAAEHDANALKVLGRRLFEVIDPEAAEREEGRRLAREEREARRKTFLRLRDNGDGSVTGSFKIPTLHAEMLKKALHALTSPRRVGAEARTGADGTRTPYPELLGMGLCELIERYPLDRLPKSGGVNATVVVTVTLEQLRAELAGVGLDTGGRISAGEMRRLACEAGIIPAVLGGRSQVLDLGRKQRFHTEPQRVAMAIRDKGCTAVGCDRPPGWCHAHHEVPWSRGGGTSVDQGRLLCPWHHGKAHDPAYATTRHADGSVRFHRRT